MSKPQTKTRQRIAEQRAFAEAVFGKTPEELEAFVRNTRERYLAGILPPQVCVLLFQYMFGKPTEYVEVEDKTRRADLEKLTPDQLRARALALALAISTTTRREVDDDEGPSTTLVPGTDAVN